MQIVKSGKRQMTEGIELPNREKIRTPRENRTYKYMGILDVDIIKKVEMKEKKIWKEYLRGTRKLLETKLYSKNLTKGINIWVVPLVRYSRPFLKWTRRKNFNQWSREQENLSQCIRPYISKITLTGYICQEMKEEEDTPAFKIASIHGYDDSNTT